MRVVTLREKEHLDLVDRDHRRFRGWLWPLDSPDVAVCVLGMLLRFDPGKLAKRECAVLELLAQGIETKSIARKLDLSVSTVHTHMKRARVKLGLRSVESLISFAARYCYPASLVLESRASSLAAPALPVAIRPSKKRLAPGVVLRTAGGKSSL